MVLSQDDFLESGDVHVKNDKLITEKELRGVERRLNTGCAMFIKIFKVGESSNHIERHRSNSITHSANHSNMKLLHKDHKGPGKVQMRRLKDPGMNIGISNFLVEILEPVADEMIEKYELGSTEEVLNKVDIYNLGWTELTSRGSV